MSECGEKLPHSCGTRKGLQVFIHGDDKVDGYCFSCGTYVEHPYGEPRKAADVPKDTRPSPEQIRTQLQEISNYKVVDVKQKKLRAAYLDQANIKVGLSEEDGKTPFALYYPYTMDGELTGYKVKILKDKKIFSIGNTGKVDLFNWDNAIKTGSKRLIITEGEDDVPAVLTILDRFKKEEYKDYKDAVVSLPHGAAAAAKDLGRLADKINKHFREIVFCFDTDKAGEAAVENSMQVFPYAKVVTLPSKDANQCIIDGVQKAAYNAIVFENKAPKKSRLLNMSELFEEASKPPEYGELSWPWPHINDKTRGIRYGETIYIGAGVKMGLHKAHVKTCEFRGSPERVILS